MAFTANTAFELKVTNHEFDSTANITGVFGSYSGDDFTAADCSAGWLCLRGKLTQNEGYPTGVMNGNTWTMVQADDAATINDVVYACNPHNVQEVTAPDGNVYKIGHNTLGIGIPAGERDTFTRIDFLPGDRHYRFGVGNLSTALSTNGYATIDDGKLVPAASAPTAAGKLWFKVLGTGTFTQGAYAGFGYVDVEAHANVIATA